MIFKATLLAFFSLAPFTAAADTFLLMAEEHGCYWCERWNEEIAHIYPKTDEGKAAPLKRYDIHDGVPTGITLTKRTVFTPTFILLHDNVEVGRIEGYPGEDFFWGLLAEMLNDAQTSPDISG